MVENKIVLITGAAQGIGYQIGERFAEDGATVVLTDLNEDGVKKAADKLKTKGYEALDSASHPDGFCLSSTT